MILYENRLPKREGATFHPHYPHHGGVTVSFKLRELTQTFKINKTLRHQTGPFLFVPLRLLLATALLPVFVNTTKIVLM